jgi:hypothetical protein
MRRDRRPRDLTSRRKEMNALRPPGHTRIHMSSDVSGSLGESLSDFEPMKNL